MDRKEIVRLTRQYGGDWALSHTRRLLKLIALIGEGLDYDRDLVWVAAHLHDWGTFPEWAKKGVNHSLRGKQVARDYLKNNGSPKAWVDKVVQCIEFHHGGGEELCLEAILLRDADALDGLGLMGLLAEFAMIPCDAAGDYSCPVGMAMRGAYERAKIRRENNPCLLSLEKSKEIARKRMAEMDRLFSRLEQESFGYL
jgi:HD superfamily phosphodiesterase